MPVEYDRHKDVLLGLSISTYAYVTFNGMNHVSAQVNPHSADSPQAYQVRFIQVMSATRGNTVGAGAKPFLSAWCCVQSVPVHLGKDDSWSSLLAAFQHITAQDLTKLALSEMSSVHVTQSVVSQL